MAMGKEKMRKFFLLGILGLFAFSFMAPFAAAAPGDDVSLSVDTAAFEGEWDTTWLDKTYSLWINGVDWKDATQMSLVANVIKWLILLLIILLVYSALAYADFPESLAIKVVIAIAIGFLSTLMITSAEMLTAIQSYTAMGIALTIFFPIMILGFFTMVVVDKGQPTGIFLQVILWLIYSVYLFIRTGVLFILKVIGPDQLTNTLGGNETATYTVWGVLKLGLSQDIIKSVSQQSSTILLTLIAVSIGVFYLMVIKNGRVIHWLGKKQVEAEIEARGKKQAESAAYEDQNSAQMKAKGHS